MCVCQCSKWHLWWCGAVCAAGRQGAAAAGWRPTAGELLLLLQLVLQDGRLQVGGGEGGRLHSPTRHFLRHSSVSCSILAALLWQQAQASS